MVGAVLFVVRNQLSCFLVPGHEVRVHELDQPVGVRGLLVLEVQTVGAFFDSNGLLVSIMLQDQLLEVKEGALVRNSLTTLNLGGPRMRCVGNLAVVALQVGHDELYLEGLLQHRVLLHFLLHRQLHFDTARVRLCPNERCVEQLDSLETLDLLEAEREQLRTLKLHSNPRRSLVPVALSAMVELHVLGDALGDVDLTFEAIDASVGGIRERHNTTNAAPDMLDV